MPIDAQAVTKLPTQLSTAYVGNQARMVLTAVSRQSCPQLHRRMVKASRNTCAVQVLTDAADSPHGTLAMICLAALARGIASSQTSSSGAARTAGILQAKLSQMFKQLAPNLQVSLVKSQFSTGAEQLA